MFVILLVIVTFSNQLWRGHHVCYDTPIRWSIIIILLHKVIVFEYIFIWYNIGSINYCYNTQITVFTKLKTKQNKTWKKRTTFQEDYFFTWKKDVKILLRDGYFSRDSNSLLLNMITPCKYLSQKNRLWPLRWHGMTWPLCVQCRVLKLTLNPTSFGEFFSTIQWSRDVRC